MSHRLLHPAFGSLTRTDKGRLPADLALRIGVAARCLPGVTVSDLVEGLVEVIGTPVNRAKLDSLTPARLRRIIGNGGQAFGLFQLEEAAAYLNGSRSIDVVDTPVPPIQPYGEGDMPNSLRVAVASVDGERLDGEFQRCRRFLVYQVSAAEIRLVAVRENNGFGSGGAGRQTQLGLIADCRLIYALTIGAAIRAKLAARGIHPVSVAHARPAREALKELQQTLGYHPPPWLARAAGLPSRYRLPEAPGLVLVCS